MILELESGVSNKELSNTRPGAIVVLGGDAEREGSGRAPVQLGFLSLQRVYYAAEQYREAALPVLVTGGQIPGTEVAIANLMAESLKNVFGVPVRWQETRSSTTYENARYSAEILKKDGISTVIIVTQRWHMPRAIWFFTRFGIRAIPSQFAAPTAPRPPRLQDLIADVSALERSSYAVHEFLGLLYYKSIYSKLD